MTVHFIGAGPGAADLLTLRAVNILSECQLCLYAGSIIPEAVLVHCPPGVRRVNTAGMTLAGIIAICRQAHEQGLEVARLHSGDLSIYSALAEQLRGLRAAGIPYSLCPGVPAFAAAAAVLGQELTVPGVAQSLVITRTQGRASAMPPGETLEHFAQSGTTLAVHLSVHVLAEVVVRLIPYYGSDCPVAVVFRASHDDEQVFRGQLADIADKVAGLAEKRSALIFVGPALGETDFCNSALYDGDHQRMFRGRSV